MKRTFYLLAFIVNCICCNFNTYAQSGIITTIAGNGIRGYLGAGGAAIDAEFNYPNGAVVDDTGNVYVSDYYNNVIWKILISGDIILFAGSRTAGYSGDGGMATAAQINGPDKVQIDGSGNIYFTDWSNNRVRKINTSGIISTIAGNGTTGYSGDGSAATSAELNHPEALSSVDDSGNIYIADELNNAIRKVSSSGIISTIAGNGTGGYIGDDGPATLAELNYPRGVAFDDSGNIYIADYHNNAIRKVNTFGIISTIAGDGTAGYSGDGAAATAAKLNGPTGLIAKGGGISGVDGGEGLNIYFADENNHAIRKIDASGIISTIAGNGTAGFRGDGGAATDAKLRNPVAVAIDNAGNLYIPDAYNYRVRKIMNTSTLVKVISTLAQFFTIFPNPATELLTIKTDGSSYSTCTITNTLGVVMLQQSISGAVTTVDIKTLPSGMYFVSLKGDGSIVRKFMKE